MGVDLSAELKEAREISTEFLGVFALQYSKMYLVALMKNAKKTLAKEAAGPQWVLLKCDKCPPPQIQKTGVVKKLSKYLKKWNSRFMVVKGDYLIEYYETEEKYIAKGKPLGVINMSNKNLHRDANDTVLNRLIALAEKCQINIEEMPKPDKYPDFTLEIYHERKGPIYLECPNEEEWHAWCDIIDKCRWHAPRYNLYEDKAHVFAFPKALWRTRWECSMWGWFYGGGGEEAQLVDAINDKIADVVLSKLERKLTMPWSVRNKIRNKFIGTVDGFVTTAVGPLWKGAYAGVKELRPKVEPKIKEGMQPIVDAQKTIQDEICKMVETSSKDFIDKSVLPHLAPLLDVVFAPVVDAFKLIIRAFDVAVEKGKEKYESKEDRLFMVWHYNYNSEYWDAERKIWDLYEPLWALRLVFEDIYPWTITGRARRRLRKTLDNALYTFENILEDGKASGKSWDEAANEARGQLARDCCTAIMRVLGHILFGVVENFFEKLVIRPARKLIKPLAEKVPQAIKDFVDPEDLLEELLYNILRRTCATVFSPYATRIDLGVEASPAADATVVTRSAAVDVAQPAATQPAAEPAAEPAAQPAAVERTDVDKSNADAAAEDAARIAAEQEAAHLAAQQAAAAEEAARIAASEAAAAAEAAQREAERAAAEEAATRQAAEKAAAEEEAARREAEAKAAEEEDARRNAERAAAEEEAARQALERAAAEEEAAREAGAQEEAARQAAEKAAADEAAARLEAERAAAEEAAAREEAARAAAEEEATRAAAERAAAEEAAALQAAQQTAAEEAAARLVAEEAAAAQQAALALEQAVEAGERALEAEAAATEKVAPTHVDMEQEREETDEGIELVYFQGKGRAHATRLVLAIGGVPFKDTRLSGEEYGALLAAGALPLETLPVMKVEGQIVSSQSQAMLRFAAELADLQLSLPEDILLGEDVLGTAEDMANVLYSPWYAAATQEDKDRIAGEIAASGFAFYAKHIEERLNDRTHNEPFIAQTVSFVDAFVYCVVSYLGAAMASTVVEHPVRAFPKLSALVDAVGAIPAVAQLE